MATPLWGMVTPRKALVGAWSVAFMLAVHEGAQSNDGIRLRAQPAPGTVLTTRYSQSIEVHLASRQSTMLLEGKEPLPFDWTDESQWIDTRSVVFRDSHGTRGDDHIVVREFVELTGEHELRAPQPSLYRIAKVATEDSALAWYRFEMGRRDGETQLLGPPRRAGIDPETLALATSRFDLSDFLGPDEVDVGTRWTVPIGVVGDLVRAARLVQYAEPDGPSDPLHSIGGESTGSVTVEFDEFLDDAGIVVLTYTFELYVSDTLPDRPATLLAPMVAGTPCDERVSRTGTLIGEGELIWDSAANYARRFRLTGAVNLTIRQEQYLAKSPVMVEVNTRWEGSLGITYAAAPPSHDPPDEGR